MLCEAPDRSGSDGLPCGQCEGCHWFGLSNHPDYRLVIPEADAEAAEEGSEAPARSGSKTASKQIRIDQVRDRKSVV